jgi:hypothetical protein
MEFGRYMFFSLVEGYAVLSLIFYIFRFNIKTYFWPCIFILLLINLQNYFIREELLLTSIAPIINLILTVFFLVIFVKIPFIWSMVMTVTGYITFGIIQTSILFLSFGYFSFQQTQQFAWKMYLAQLLSGVLGTFIGWLLYKRGYGFSFSFEKLRLKWERVFIGSLLSAFFLALVVMMAYKDVFINLIVLAITLFLLFIYAMRKEIMEP